MKGNFFFMIRILFLNSWHHGFLASLLKLLMSSCLCMTVRVVIQYFVADSSNRLEVNVLKKCPRFLFILSPFSFPSALRFSGSLSYAPVSTVLLMQSSSNCRIRRSER